MLYEVIIGVAGTGGIIGGVYSLFTMRVKKESIIIENLKNVINEIRENHKDYKQETDEKFKTLERKVEEMQLKDEIKTRAINQGYRCKFIPKDSQCPVTKLIDSTFKIIDKCTNNKE